MQNVVLTIHLLLALGLIGVVLMQRSEGGGLGIGGGGGANTAGRSAANALTKLTWILAVCFLATSITLTILAASGSGNGSVVDSVTAPITTDTPTENPLGDNLLPPSSSDEPALPPTAE
ncbi:preprotein translocase subunit SecG [Amylibacter kogurei]|uniref:Protein-export membrane protein SecG n=1 Tax=Paramylibacter kogurei TaxID=1889778 RepID=A0A2G5K4K0_9RHOB|nr:preprotein translocase subunit SecG [Amylibacter kogurei]PIB24477.1 preprotein translocase subunit SecG [Amylibacter kogurei]